MRTQPSNHRLSTTPPPEVDYAALPGKLLILFLCIVPFFILNIAVNPSAMERALYWMGANAACSDYETYPREWILIGIASLTAVWFVLERFVLRRPSRIASCAAVRIQWICAGIYALTALLSGLFSAYRKETWLGTVGLYEGTLALISYMILFLGMTYFSDRPVVTHFFQNAILALGWIMGILVLLEHIGLDYYNFSLVQWLSGLTGTRFYPVEAATISFGNPDYLSAVCAMLLPISLSCIRRTDAAGRFFLAIGSTILYAIILLMTKVTSAIAFGFLFTLLFGLLRLHRSNFRTTWKKGICLAAAGAVALSGAGYLFSRTGDTVAEKLRHGILGMDPQSDSFGLTHMEIQGNTLLFQAKEQTLTVTYVPDDQPALTVADLAVQYNGTPLSPQYQEDGSITFPNQPDLSMCRFSISQRTLSCDLGYATAVKFCRSADSDQWMVEILGGAYVEQVPCSTDSEWVQQNYALLNGRIFIWANTLQHAKDCLLLGHGASTSIFYLTQSDLTALLNIFGTYVLISKPHNWYLQMWQDTGGLSLLAMLSLIGVFLYQGSKRCKKPLTPEQAEEEPFRLGLFCGMCAYFLVGIFTDSMIYTAPLVWMTFGLAWRKNCIHPNKS